jgi:hypothetical protein
VAEDIDHRRYYKNLQEELDRLGLDNNNIYFMYAKMGELAKHHLPSAVDSLEVARRMALLSFGLGEEWAEVKANFGGGLFHDIGKIDIDPEILNKPGVLSPSEKERIRQHVTLTGDVAQIEHLSHTDSWWLPISQAMLCHHMIPNGVDKNGVAGYGATGLQTPGYYPDIPEIAMRTRVCDYFVASRRRDWAGTTQLKDDARRIDKAIQQLKEEGFDSQRVESLRRVEQIVIPWDYSRMPVLQAIQEHIENRIFQPLLNFDLDTHV